MLLEVQNPVSHLYRQCEPVAVAADGPVVAEGHIALTAGAGVHRAPPSSASSS